MRVVPFVLSLVVTIGLIFLLNIQLTVQGNKTPVFGEFLSPQHGFWQNAEPTSTDFNATLQFPELEGKVDVYFDERLVPHVYAEKENDAYFVQGYLHAKFRLWQMEFQTFAAAGRLSEIMGDSAGGTSFLAIDKHFRRLGMVYGAEQSLGMLEADPVTKRQTDAYTTGVNAYITHLRPGQIPFEYKLLNYKPEKWTNLKTVLFAKYVANELSGREMDFEMTNARSIFTPGDIENLYPTIADSLEPIIPKGTLFQPASVIAKRPFRADSTYFPLLNTAKSRAKPYNVKPHKNNGSNNWAVAGSKTRSGTPILCNDPHLGLNMPSIWYEMQISTPTFNAYGVSFPGAPSIIIGFNDSIAWGITSAERDVKDYYEITFKDSTMQEYMYNGAWTKTTFRDEVIKIKGKANNTVRVAMTVFGPVMFDKTYPNILENGKCYAVRWTGNDPSNELLVFNKINHARNYIDFIRALSSMSSPGLNFNFAAKDGTIAIKQQGRFPAKWYRQGDFVMPGKDSSYLWQAIIPSRENPTLYNPERGFVSSANQRPVDENYPYYLGSRPVIYRGLIINRMLRQQNNITIKDMKKMQTDNYDVFAEMARPVLLKYLDESKLSPDEMTYVNQLKAWNLRDEVNEQGATIFKLWWDSLTSRVFNDEFSRTDLPIRLPEESTLLDGLQKDSTYKFVDDIRTPKIETVRQIVTEAYMLAYKDLKIADNEHRLSWGKFKDTGVRHLLKLPALSRLHLPVAGGVNCINATIEDHGPSWRMIVQFSDNIEAYGIYPGGESGNPGSKYYDNFIDSWLSGQYYPLLFLGKKAAEGSRKMRWRMKFSKA